MQGTAGVIQGTRRITAIVDGLAKHLGLKMALKKCFTGPIIKLDASMVGATTKKDVEEMGWKFVCEDVRCGAHFRSYMGLRTHQRSCQFHIEEFKQDDDGDDGHDIDALLAVRGPPDRRFWRVKWAGKNADGSEKWPDLGDGLGYKDDDSRWQDERNLGSETLGMRQRYFRFNRKPSQSSDCEVDGEHRCSWCNQFFKSASALKGHRTKGKRKGGCHKKPPVRVYKGTEVDRYVKRKKLSKLIAALPSVMMMRRPMKNILADKYLGHIEQFDGNSDIDIVARCDGAKRKFNTLNHIWKDKGLGRMLRLSIYLRGVISKLVYGNEAWRLRKTEVRALNGWNSRCVSRITGQTSHEEASEKTRTITLLL